MLLLNDDRSSAHPSARRGFSLVELLVAMALIVFLMSILGAGFSEAGKVFSHIKATSDQQEQLRGVLTLLRRDLAMPHFDTTGNRRLGSSSFWRTGDPPPNDFGPPPQGFVRIYQDATPAVHTNGTDPPTFTASRSAIHFSVALLKLRPDQVFSTLVPAGHPTLSAESATERALRYQFAGNSMFSSEWAEVAYWLGPDASTEGPGGTTDLFILRRRARVMWWTNATTSSSLDAATVLPTATPEVSSRPQGATGSRVNKPEDVTVPPFRFAMQPGNLAGLPLSPAPAAAYPIDNLGDIVAFNVLSFDIRVLLQNGTRFVDLSDPSVQAFSMGNPQFPSSGTRFAFDTWSRRDAGGIYDYRGPVGAAVAERWQVPGTDATIPLFRNATNELIRIRAIQVTMRIWDRRLARLDKRP